MKNNQLTILFPTFNLESKIIMHIQWYPGHMHKASKEIREALPKVDLVIEVLDARIPYSSQNPVLSQLRQDKPCIRVLNKSDLADPDLTQQWQTYLEQEQGVKTLTTSSLNPLSFQQIIKLCEKLFPEKNKPSNPIRAMIMGIPNVGKSTIINKLAGKTIAKTGNEPAVTKAQQRIKISDHFILFDTPGVLWPKIENPNSSYRLAITGAIKDTAWAFDDISAFAAEYLLKFYPNVLKSRYQLDQLPDEEIEFLEIIGKKCGCIGANNWVNFDKIGKLLIQEIRSSKLGALTFEQPHLIEQELDEVMIMLSEKAAEKEAKKAARKKRAAKRRR